MRAWFAPLSVIALSIVGCVSLDLDFGGSWGGGSHGSTRATKDGTFSSDVVYFSHNGRIELILLVEGSASGSVGGTGGSILVPTGRTVRWSCPSGRNGRELRIDDRAFPLKAGRVFHIDVRDGRTLVQQLDLNPDELAGGSGSVRENVRTNAAKHAIVAGFFARCEPSE